MPTEDQLRANPFRDRGEWFWRDDNQVAHGPFPSQIAALRGLLRHMDDRGRWVKLKEAFQEFMAA